MVFLSCTYCVSDAQYTRKDTPKRDNLKSLNISEVSKAKRFPTTIRNSCLGDG